MDEALVAAVRAWLAKAVEDLRAAERLLDGPDPLCAAAAFHCQQAAEKVLKAYLAWKEASFGRTHSLVALVGQCLVLEPSFETLRSAAVTLTPYAVALRYPGDLPDLTDSEAAEALHTPE